MKKNVASQAIGAQMITAADGTAFTGSVTVYVTGDAGTQALGSVGSGACTHEGNGYHTYAPAQSETNYDIVAFTFIGTGAIPTTVQVYTIPATGLLAPTTAGRTLDIQATGEADVNVTLVGGQTASATGAVDFDDLATIEGLASGATGFAAIDTVVDAIKTKTDFLPSATAGDAGGVFIAGTNAATTITSSSGSALTLSSTGSNGSGLATSGNGTGAGILSTGGSSNGPGLQATAGTGGHGMLLSGEGFGVGLYCQGGDTGKGSVIQGGATSGIGLHVISYSGDALQCSATGGDGIDAISASGGVDIRGDITGNITGNLSGSVANVTGGINTAAGTITTLDGLDTAQDTQHTTTQNYLTNNLGANGAAATEAGGTGDQFTAIPWNASWDAEVQSEVDDALDTAISELTVAAPTATPTLRTGLMLLYMMARNKLVVQTSGTDAIEVYNDAGTKICSKLITDDGSDYTEAEMT